MGKDLWESLSEWLHERATSPILSTFTAMWVVCNYKVVIVLISENSYLDRFEYLDTYKVYDAFFIHRLLLPIALTGGYLWFYPILRNFVYDYWSELQADMDNIKVKNFKKKTLSEEEKLELIDSNVELKKKYETDMKERDELIRLLNSQVASLKSETPSSNKAVEEDQLYTTMKLILRQLSVNTSMRNNELYGFITNVYGIDFSTYGAALGRATASGYIRIQGTADFAEIYLTPEGHNFIND